MKKDLDWLNNELEKVIKDVESDDISFAGKKDYDEGYIDSIRDVQSIVNQLNEPETVEETTRLLENVLKENKRLGKLLEEKHEEWLELMDEMNNRETETLSPKWIDDNSVYASSDGVTEEYIHVDELQNLLMPKQEMPVIPEFVADWIEEKAKELPYVHNPNFRANIIADYFKSAGQGKADELAPKELIKWLDNGKVKDFMIATITGNYEVEEEQKYYVSARAEEYSGFWFLSKNNNGDISVGTNKDYFEADWDTLKLTEQEIKDYDERYMAFAKPVVVCN